jgi:hypothetical protein
MEKEKVMSGFDLHFNLVFTLSKLAAYLILIIGSMFAFYFHDATVLISSFGISGGLLGLKNWSDSQVSKHNNTVTGTTQTTEKPIVTVQKKMDETG